ncbi:unnamed protein product [Peronospora effusa]|nr:unnamed protein product [Peronospora effusa]
MADQCSVAGTKTGIAKIVSERLLGHQLSLWGKEKIGNPGSFYKLLELQQTGDKLFESPLFPRPVQASRSD